MNFVWETPEEINMALAHRLSAIRKRQGLTQQTLSEKSNVSFGSIKRFETSRQISLISLTKLCVALGCVDEIKRLFTYAASTVQAQGDLHRYHTEEIW